MKNFFKKIINQIQNFEYLISLIKDLEKFIKIKIIDLKNFLSILINKLKICIVNFLKIYFIYLIRKLTIKLESVKNFLIDELLSILERIIKFDINTELINLKKNLYIFCIENYNSFMYIRDMIKKFINLGFIEICRIIFATFQYIIRTYKNNFFFFIFINYIIYELVCYFFAYKWYGRNPEYLFSCVPLLKFLIIPFFGLLHLSLINKNEILYLQVYSVFWSLVIIFGISYLNEYATFCIVNLWKVKKLFALLTFVQIPVVKFLLYYGVDSFALLFLGLTAGIFCLIFFYLAFVYYDNKNYKKIILTLYIMHIMLIQLLTTDNIFLFFFFFESIVFPMYYLISLDGSRFQKIKAANYFFYFTIFSSLFMFISINYLVLALDNINIHILLKRTETLSLNIQILLWLSFFISFITKIPLFPFHTWLPEAHVEAPTYASVLLAGVLLKLGVYGILRICFLLFPKINYLVADYVIILAVVSMFYSAIIAVRQSDVKRIIAYASIAHMSLIVVGLYSYNIIGIYGAVFQSISHGFVASVLFFSIGVIYDRYKTRIYYYLGGLVISMPLFSFIFLISILANFSFPLSSNFIGELLIFIGLRNFNLGVIILSISSIILSTAYSLWLCNRILFGNLKSQFLEKDVDIFDLESFILIILLSISLILGIFPNILFESYITQYNICFYFDFLTINTRII